MTQWIGRRKLLVVTACLNASGFPDFALHEVEVTCDEYANGVHCDLVEEQLVVEGYEEPFLHFDQYDGPQFLVSAVLQYLGVSSRIPEHTPATLTEDC